MKETKNYKIDSCHRCLFKVVDIDYDSIGKEIYCYCNLIKNTSTKDNVIGIFSEEEYFQDLDLTEPENKILENCPLREINLSLELK